MVMLHISPHSHNKLHRSWLAISNIYRGQSRAIRAVRCRQITPILLV